MKRIFIKGIGLLELMLSLSIIAILLLLATRYYLTTSYSQRLRQLTQEITAIQGAIYTWKVGSPTYSSLSVSDLLTQGLLAKADTTGTGSSANLVTPWGTTINVAPAASSVTLTFTASGDEEGLACDSLAKALTANAASGTSASCSAPKSGGQFSYTFQ